MQALNISNLTYYKLEALATRIPEIKYVSISSVNSTLTMLRSLTPNFWLPMKVKLVSAIGTPTTVIKILFVSITLYCKCFENGNSCVHEHIRPVFLPVNDTHIHLDPISNLLPDPSEKTFNTNYPRNLKACGVDFSKFQHFKHCKAKCQTATQVTKV